jgi:sec-independent protein translocase protein TatC
MAIDSTQPTPEELEEAQSRMSFGEHLEELRKRIMRALFGSLPIVGVCLFFYKEILLLIAEPYRVVAKTHHAPGYFFALKPQEVFLTSITLAFQAGLVLASPWIIYQLWQFVAAGLFERERRIVYRYTVPSALLFLAGVAFFYFIVLPMTLNFFFGFAANTAGPPPKPNVIERMLGFGEPATMPATTGAATSTAPGVSTAPANTPLAIPVLMDDPPAPPAGQTFIYNDGRDGSIKARTGDEIVVLMVAPQNSMFTTSWRFDDYLSFVTFTALLFGIAFELPMVILILAQTRIVETQTFRSIRKYAYFIIVVVAAIAAPSGDPATLFLLAVPLIGLYEFGIVAAAVAVRRQDRRAAET